VFQRHGGKERAWAYAKQFGRESMVSDDLRRGMAEIFKDHVEDGTVKPVGKKRPRGICKNGHRVTAASSYLDAYGNRVCRKCMRIWAREQAFRTGKIVNGRRYFSRRYERQKCEGCSRWFVPHHPQQRYHSLSCAKVARERIKRGGPTEWPTLVCAAPGCRKKFVQRRMKQATCSEACRLRYRRVLSRS
jgi:hypothetical protein